MIVLHQFCAQAVLFLKSKEKSPSFVFLGLSDSCGIESGMYLVSFFKFLFNISIVSLFETLVI